MRISLRTALLSAKSASAPPPSPTGPNWLLGLEVLGDNMATSAQSIDGHVLLEQDGFTLRVHFDTAITGPVTSWDAKKVSMPNAHGPGFNPDGTPNDAVPRVLPIVGVGRPFRPYPESDDAGDAKYTDYEAGPGYIDIAMSQRLFNGTITDYTGRAYFTNTGDIVFAPGFLNGTSEGGTAPSTMVIRSDSLEYWPSIWKPLVEIYPRVPANGTLDIEWTAGSLLAQQGQPVACIEAWPWNGTTAGPVARASVMTENSATAGLTAPSGYTFDSFKTTLDFNGQPHGPMRIRSRIKPWEGPAIESIDAGDNFDAAFTQNLLKEHPVYHDLNNDRFDIFAKIDPVGGRTSANKAGVFTSKAAALADQGFINIKLAADSGVLFNLDSTLKGGAGKTHDTTDGLRVVLPSSPATLGSNAGTYCIDVQITAKTGYFPLIIESESGFASLNGVMRGQKRDGSSIALTAKTLGTNTKRVKVRGLILENKNATGDDRTVIYGGPAATNTPLGADAYYMSFDECQVLGETPGASRFPVDGTTIIYIRRSLFKNNRFRVGWDSFAGPIYQIGSKFTGDTNTDGACLLACWQTDGAVTDPNQSVGNQCMLSQLSSPRGKPGVPPTRQFFVHNTRLDTWNHNGIGGANDPPGRAKDIQLRYWAGLIFGGRFANSNNTLLDFSDDLITPGTERTVIKGLTTAGMPLLGDTGVGFMRTNGWYNDNGWIGANKTVSIQFSYFPAIPMKGSWFNTNSAFVTGPGVANPPSIWDSSKEWFPGDPVYDPATGGGTPQTGAFTAQARQYKPNGDKIEVVPIGTPLTDGTYWYYTGSNVTGHQANRNRNIGARLGIDSYCVLRSDSYYPSEPLEVGPLGQIADYEWPGSFEISPGVSSFTDVVTSTLYENDVCGDGADPTAQNLRPKAGSPLLGLRPPECRWDLRDPLGQIRPTSSYGAAAALEIVPDLTPGPFDFPDVSNADVSTPYTSDPVTPDQFNTPTAISVSPGGFYSINGGPFVSTPDVFPPGASVRARMMSSAAASTPTNCTVTIGGVSGTFTVTTAAAGSVPVLLSQPNLTGLNADGTADIGSVLTCPDGSWSGSPTGFARQWKRNGADIPGANGTTYTPGLADTLPGTQIRCQIIASNTNGASATETSNTVNVFHPYQIAIAYWDLEDTTKTTIAGGKLTAWASGGTGPVITASEVSGSGITYSATAINSARPGITGNLTSMYLEALSSGAGGTQDFSAIPVGSTGVELYALVQNSDVAINTRAFFGYANASSSGDRQVSLSKANVSGVGGLQAAAGCGSGTVIVSNNSPFSGRFVVHAVFGANTVDGRLNGTSGSTPTSTTRNALAQRLRIMASPINVSTNPGSFGSLISNGMGLFPTLTTAQRASLAAWGNARLGF